MEEVKLTVAQFNRYQTIKKALAGALTNQRAANALRRSIRQVQRLKRRVKQKGAAGMIHGNTGRKPHNAIPPSIKEQAIRLASDDYQNYNFSHLADTLAEEHKITISDETLRRWLRPIGLGKAQRRLKKHRRRRKRREHEGELLFLDGSPHPWFGQDAGEVCLLLASDDATGKPLWGKFQPNEDRNGCFEVCYQVFKKFGLATAFYLDRASQFTTTRHGGTHVQQGPEVEDTHFERAMAQLAIGLIFAHSPQARGRGERLNGSFQQRLVAELIHKGIKDCKTATKYLNQVFIPKYQKRFAQLPVDPRSAWRPVPKELDLKSVLAANHERMVANDNTVSFEAETYQLTPPPGRCHLLHARIQVQEHFDGTIHFLHPKLGELKAKKIEFDQRRKQVA
jgi:transposase